MRVFVLTEVSRAGAKPTHPSTGKWSICLYPCLQLGLPPTLHVPGRLVSGRHLGASWRGNSGGCNIECDEVVKLPRLQCLDKAGGFEVDRGLTWTQPSSSTLTPRPVVLACQALRRQAQQIELQAIECNTAWAPERMRGHSTLRAHKPADALVCLTNRLF